MERRDIMIARGEIARRIYILLWWQPCRLRGQRWCRRHACLYRFNRLDRVSPYHRICVGANDEQMAALELGISIPMPIEQPRENLRLHLVLLQLVIALLVARVILAIRIHRRHEDDVLLIWRPDGAVGSG